jgi:Flp pilus assembly protein TadG
MVTAELAVCLPVLVLILAAALSAVQVTSNRIRVQDAAREAARALARGDRAHAQSLARADAPGVEIASSTEGEDVVVTARLRVHLLANWLPAVTVSGRAVAALEPRAGSP